MSIAHRVLLLALAFVSTGGPAFGSIVVSNVLRSLSADSVVSAPDAVTNTTPGPFTALVLSSGSGGGVIVQSGGSSQTSSTPNVVGATLSGQGRAGAGYTGADGATINPVFDSLFDVAFNVDVTQSYSLTAAVEWSGTFSPIDGFAMVELKNVTLGTTLALARVNAGQFAPNLQTSFVLQPGTAYRLVAEGKVFGPPNEFTPLSGDAQWSFTLTAVPEAGSMTLATVATTLGSAGVAWRRRLRGAMRISW